MVHAASGREWRGGERQVLLLARALANEPDLHQLVLTSRGGELERRLVAEMLPVRGIPWAIGLDPRALFHLCLLSRPSRSSRPILHAHDSHAVTLSALASRWSGAPLIATRRVDFSLRRPWPWQQATRVIAVSNAVRDVGIADGLDPDRVQVIHSGIDLDAAPAAGGVSFRQRLGLTPNSKLAVNIAALVGHKDHRTLIAAATLLVPRLPDLHWAVAGAGPLRTELLREIASANLTSRVHLLGPISDPMQLLASADVFVMSSRQEGLGTSVMDAMRLGIPVVATRAGGLPELLAGGAGLLCPIENPAALASVVEQVLTQPNEAERLRGAGLVRAQQFSYMRMAAEQVSVYRSVDQYA